MSGTKAINITDAEIVEFITPTHMGKIKISGVRNDKKQIVYMVDVSARRGVVSALCIIEGQKPVGVDVNDFPTNIAKKLEELINVNSDQSS